MAAATHIAARNGWTIRPWRIAVRGGFFCLPTMISILRVSSVVVSEMSRAHRAGNDQEHGRLFRIFTEAEKDPNHEIPRRQPCTRPIGDTCTSSVDRRKDWGEFDLGHL